MTKEENRRAVAAMQSGAFEEAAKIWSSILQREPDNERAGMMLVDSLKEIGDTNGAISVALEVIAKYPDNRGMLLFAARELYKSKQLDEAYAYACRFLEVQKIRPPVFPGILLKIARCIRWPRSIRDRLHGAATVGEFYTEDMQSGYDWAQQYKAQHEAKSGIE